MALQLYLIRHGIAADRQDYVDDAQRPLTAKGEKKTRQIAVRLKQVGVKLDLLLTSPLVRAQQTAELLEQAGITTQVQQSDDLAPGGRLTEWLNWLQTWLSPEKAALGLVGHQPDLTEWAEQLVWGTSRDVLALPKAGIIGVNLPNHGSPIGASELFWLTRPGLFL